MEVETASGAVPVDRLGAVLMHEHLFVGDHELAHAWPQRFAMDREQVVAAAVAELDAAAGEGVGAIVDATVMGLGRDIGLVRDVAAKTSIPIILATGAYVIRDLPAPLQLVGPGRTAFGGPEPLVELFVADIEVGIAATSSKAALIKCATDRHGVTRDVERVLRAAAQAAVATGVTVITHTNAKARVGLDQQRIFAEEGLALDRIVIGHCGDTDDLDYLRALLAAGSALGMDRFGLEYFCEDRRRVDTVARLCSEGYAEQIVLSHDSTSRHAAYTPEQMRGLAPHSHLLHLSRTIGPMLLDAGVTEQQLEQMTVTNPARILPKVRA